MPIKNRQILLVRKGGFFMQLIHASHLKKQYGERILFSVTDLRIYSEDKIGIIGLNGSGKTTLIKVLMGLDHDYSGQVQLDATVGYIPQLNLEDQMTLSGGEFVKQKIDLAFNQQVNLMIADEPTSNLDMDGVRYLENKMQHFKGGILLISHDVELLNKVCNKILELERGKMTLYKGNYHDYLRVKEKEKAIHASDYEKYIKEKNRLEAVIKERDQNASEFKKAPKRMGNSEARLHKRSAGERRAKVERVKTHMQERVEKLEKKDKPFEAKDIKIQVPVDLRIHSKILIQGQHVKKQYGDKVLMNDSQFKVENNKRTVIIGPNGCGKTTMLNMISSGSDGITKSPQLKIGYFRQNLDNLKNELSVLENVLETTGRSEMEVRNILANFLIKKEDVFKPVEVLSGGERIKASFAKVFLSDINFLILDEPTNYLDLNTKRSLEEALLHYEGPVLIVSHDRSFISKVAEAIIYFDHGDLHTFNGDFKAFENRNVNKKMDEDHTVKLMLLENRLNVVISQLSMPLKEECLQQLEGEYQILLSEIKEIKSKEKFS